METLADRLIDGFRWTDDRRHGNAISDVSAWWRDAALLHDLGPGLAALHVDARPTVVLSIEATGFVVASLVALHLEVGLAEIRKDTHPDDVAEKVHRRTIVDDYQGRDTVLAMRPALLGPRDRVLFVDDWIETGAHALAAQDLVGDAGATWVGAAVIVDAAQSGTRRRLNVKGLVREAELRW